MVQVSQITRVGKFLGMQGKMTIQKAQAPRPTLLDSFKAQLSSDRMVYSNIRKINKKAFKEMPKTKEAFIDELKKNGLDVFDANKILGESKEEYAKRLEQAKFADVIFSSRVKGVDSTRSKMLKQIEKLKIFDENPEMMDKKTRDAFDDAKEMFENFFAPKTTKEKNNILKQIRRIKNYKVNPELKNYEERAKLLAEVEEQLNFTTVKSTNEKYKFLVGDTLGLRISSNVEAKNGEKISDIVFKSLGNLDKNTKIKTKRIENYFGEGINPYTTRKEIEKYFDSNIYAQTEKKYGYTRVNSDINANGVNGEFQYGGKYTSPWGDKEHVLYDKRSNKKLDTSHYTPEQTRLAKEIRKKYGQLLKDTQKDEKYALYLKEVWKNARIAEETESQLILPNLPKDFNQILSAENIMKL